MGPIGNSLNIDAKPFFVATNIVKASVGSENVAEGLKRSRSVNADTLAIDEGKAAEEGGNKARRRSNSPEKNGDWSEFLPDGKDFEDAIIAAVLGSSIEPEKMKLIQKIEGGKIAERKIEKRLKVFQDITASLSPRA